MVLRIPDYFEVFHCLGEGCPDSCCVGFELDIDEQTFEYYKSVKGAFGRRLRDCLEEAEVDGGVARSFCLEVDGRCPFLNERNLCEIVLTLGAEALPEVCTEYPRRTFVFGGCMSRSLVLSCPEVARMLLTSVPPVHFPEVDLSQRVFANAFPEGAADEEGVLSEEVVRGVRDRAIEILEDRKRPFGERLFAYWSFVEKVQRGLDLGGVPADTLAFLQGGAGNVVREADGTDRDALPCPIPSLAKEIELLGQMETMDPRWEAVLDALRAREALQRETSEAGCIRTKEKRPHQVTFFDEIRVEHLMTYYTDRYFPMAFYDGDILGKAAFGIFSLCAQLDMLSLRGNAGEEPATQDWIEVVSLFSRVVEDSEDNTELLLVDYS